MIILYSRVHFVGPVFGTARKTVVRFRVVKLVVYILFYFRLKLRWQNWVLMKLPRRIFRVKLVKFWVRTRPPLVMVSLLYWVMSKILQKVLFVIVLLLLFVIRVLKRQNVWQTKLNRLLLMKLLLVASLLKPFLRVRQKFTLFLLTVLLLFRLVKNL